MLKTKYLLSALCMLVAMTMATSAFAQGIFSVSSSIEPRARMNGHTETGRGHHAVADEWCNNRGRDCRRVNHRLRRR